MIDPTALVASDVRIGDNVRIDAYATVEDDVEIGNNSHIGSHSVIRSHTRMGEGNRVHEFAVIGGEPQSVHYQGEATGLRIGDNNTIREFVTISRGTASDRGVTTIGDDNYLMAYVHVGHDCDIGNNCVFVNGTNIAGHVCVGDYAFLSGFTMIHQSCRIGTHCMTGINTILRQDVAPFVTVNGNPARSIAINSRGLSRRGFSQQSISALSKVFKLFFRKNVKLEKLPEALDAGTREDACVRVLLEFLGSTERGVVR
ncbi:MAG: acyl-ACP--UDP-N-acetylglucosamine O-acyltransferase [Acidiferrobacterales bacterium]|nr:acyl-ACP--UDP-N-acetylglucosamine O-acyltransferase [Acidiferrobacterales bacterium]